MCLRGELLINFWCVPAVVFSKKKKSMNNFCLFFIKSKITKPSPTHLKCAARVATFAAFVEQNCTLE